MEKISPKYKIHLVDRIAKAIWDEYRSYAKVLAYIEEWHTEEYYNSFDYNENFVIAFKDKEQHEIDLFQTLSGMDGELTIKIAIDMGIETPDYIPSIPTFRNEIKDHYHNASEVFEKAYRDVEKDPAIAIGLANSALESIIKDECISLNIQEYNEHSTLTELIKLLMKHYRDCKPDFPDEIRLISNSLINASKGIEGIRSDKTSFHGKSSGCKIIDDSAFAYFIVNATATIGLFIMNYRKNDEEPSETEDMMDLPF